MRVLTLIIGFIYIQLALIAKEVSYEDALQAATSFFQSKNTLTSKSLAIGGSAAISGKAMLFSGKTSFFAFNRGSNGGFVLIAGDDRVCPILGYADKGTFDTASLAPQTKVWLSFYSSGISELSTQVATVSEKKQSEGSVLVKETAEESSNVVSPLLKTQWGQTQYYNDKCPYDATVKTHTYTGCVATAMAQIMNYWQYPASGNGSHSYTAESSPQYGTLSADFGNTTYHWSNMPESLTSTNDAIATLMFHCGVSVEMDYTTSGSSALVRGTYPYTAEKAFVNFFNYASSITSKTRSSMSEEAWISLLKEELSNGRPVLYNAQDVDAGGHAFVIDGYDSNDYFHINWGWNGIGDGYYLIRNLNPLNYNFDKAQSALFDIVPVSKILNLAENISLSSDTVQVDSVFSSAVKVRNDGNTELTGNLCIQLFSADKGCVLTSDTLSISLSPANVSENLIFSSLKTYLPGKYTARLFYSPNGTQWIPVQDNTFKNEAKLIAIKQNVVKVASELTFNRTRIVNGEPLTAKLTVSNVGNQSFANPVRLVFYQGGANPMGALDADNLITIPSGASKDLLFTAPVIEESAGSYTMVAEYYLDSKWISLGGTVYLNGQQVEIDPAIVEDKYEDNNAVAKACVLNVDSLSLIATTKSTDQDFYKIVFSGERKFSYTLTLQTTQLKSVLENEANVLLSWATDTNSWSVATTASHLGKIIVKTGDTLFVRVIPASNVEAGSYSLAWNVISQKVIEAYLPITSSLTGLYPNPATDQISMDESLSTTVFSWRIVSLAGQIHSEGMQAGASISISSLRPGTYVFLAQTTSGVFQQKFIKK